MANPLEVFWSDRASRDFKNIISYLKIKWSEKEINNFISKLNQAVYLISSRPHLFALTSQRGNLRRCVLTKQTTIYYQEHNGKIYIISLYDNRRDPLSAP